MFDALLNTRGHVLNCHYAELDVQFGTCAAIALYSRLNTLISVYSKWLLSFVELFKLLRLLVTETWIQIPSTHFSFTNDPIGSQILISLSCFHQFGNHSTGWFNSQTIWLFLDFIWILLNWVLFFVHLMYSIQVFEPQRFILFSCRRLTMLENAIKGIPRQQNKLQKEIFQIHFICLKMTFIVILFLFAGYDLDVWLIKMHGRLKKNRINLMN